MQSTFAGIEIGKRSLTSHTQGLSTIGHNLSNASVEGYSRQRVQLKAFDPIYNPALNREAAPGQIGQGVTIASVERVHDQILEGRIVSQANGQGYWTEREKYLLMVEQVYNEPVGMGVRSLMDQFWDSWQDLSIHPEETSSRLAVIQRGEALIDGIHQNFKGLKEIRDMLELDINVNVSRVNNILNDISGLNEQIVKVKAMGDNPNDLLDRRDLLVKELSGILDITVENKDPDEFLIHTGGLHLIQGKIVHHLEAKPDPLNEGYSTVYWKDSGEEAFFRGGSLPALVELRDSDVKESIKSLDMMTMNFIDLVNENHKTGYGINGKTGNDFFTEYPFINNLLGNYDRSGDGEYDSSYIFRITGVNSLSLQEQVGLQGTLTLSGRENDIEIDYFPTDTVEDIVKRINNSGSEVVARVDNNGKLSLKASPSTQKENPDFVIRHIEDSGKFFVGYAGVLLESGPNGAFKWDQADAVVSLRGGDLEYAVAPYAHPSGWIEVNKALVNDPGSIAAGFGVNGRAAETGDSSAASAIAALRNSNIMVGQIDSFDDYFAGVIAEAGLKGEIAQRALDTENLIMKELEGMRESISGVNIDEELSQMIKFQHGYTAAARFISEMDKMLDTIINRMGV